MPSEVEAIFLSIWREGKSFIDLKGVDASSEIRTAVGGAIYQWSIRSKPSDRTTLKEAHDYLKTKIDAQNKEVSIEAISSLMVTSDPEDVSSFFSNS